MNQLSSVDYHHLVKELQAVVNGRIDKVYHEENLIYFAVYTGKQRLFLAFQIPTAAFLTNNKPSFNPPKGFGVFLRKRLRKSRIVSLEQLGFDRIIKMVCETPDNKYNLYFEMFGKGNLLVCDSEDTIISALNQIVYSDRSLRGGVKYTPPSPQLEVRKLSYDEFKKFFGEEECVIVLAKDLSLGGSYANLLCQWAGVDPKAKSVDTKILYDKIQELFENPTPCSYNQEVYSVLVSEQAKRYDSLSKAIASIIEPQIFQKRHEEQQKIRSKGLTKAQSMLKQQLASIKKNELMASNAQRAGELLYTHYQAVNDLITNAQKDRKQLDEKTFRTKYESHPLVKKADKNNLVLELPDE